MFSVIGVGGGVFRGSLEHLLAAHRVPPLRHLRGIDQDVDEPATEAHVGPASDDGRYHAAAAAYAAAERPHPERGPVYHAYQVMSRHVLTLSPEVSVVERFVGMSEYEQMMPACRTVNGCPATVTVPVRPRASGLALTE